MTRPKGSKNKPKIDAGNPEFNIKAVEPSQTIGTNIAPGAILPEDMELERTLQAMTQALPVLADEDPTVGVVRKVKETREMLGDVVDDYSPASTHAQLQEQAALAFAEGCDSIEATLQACRTVCRDPQLEAVGYFTYHGIKVYLVGAFEKVKSRDKVSVEQRTFGTSTEAERREALRKQIETLEKQLNEH